MTKKQFLLLLFCSGTLFRVVAPESRSQPPAPAENAFISVTDMFEAPGDKKDKGKKTVFVTALIENGAMQSLDFTGFFSLHTAKVADKEKRYYPALAYKLEADGFNLVAEPIVDFFKDKPFSPGEKRSVAMAFSVPVTMKPTKIYIPTQNGSIELDLAE